MQKLELPHDLSLYPLAVYQVNISGKKRNCQNEAMAAALNLHIGELSCCDIGKPHGFLA